MIGATKRAGVIGWPVEHSKSPRLHGHWLAKFGIDGSYVHLPIKPEDLETSVRKMVVDGWQGANVTIPHKEAALTLADEATPRARAIGAANTLIFREGRIIADNTDGYGFIENLHDRTGAAWDHARPAVVLGAGGAARAILHALIDAGVPEICVANRTVAKAATLAAPFGDAVRVIALSDVDNALRGAGLIVNTTSLGMTGQPPLNIDLTGADDDAVATDIVYTPLITPFLASAQARGLTVVDGLGMLLHQARPGFAAWFGAEPQVDDELRQLMVTE
ncbi:MAG: shikimate dehydrogenase [Pseudomonadota bacterium]